MIILIIDTRLIRAQNKVLLTDARSFGGALASSDHKIVITNIQLSQKYRVYKVKKPKTSKIDCSRLAACKDVQANYQEVIKNKICSTTLSEDPDKRSKSILEIVESSAKETVGMLPAKRIPHFSLDPQILRLSDERHKLRLKLQQNNKAEDHRSQRTKINQLQKAIKHRIKDIKEAKADQLSKVITETDDTRKMFEAVRILAQTKTKSSITVPVSYTHLTLPTKA